VLDSDYCKIGVDYTSSPILILLVGINFDMVEHYPSPSCRGFLLHDIKLIFMKKTANLITQPPLSLLDMVCSTQGEGVFVAARLDY
jgi:hypothetical protein